MINLKQDAVTALELAEQLNVSPSTLATWRSRGTAGPKFIRIAGRIYYLKADVEQWFNEQLAAA
ncbi:helix-turn-helix domain-containing protein [Corynebacterium phoceense]|uniref:Helix-turn-helix domain-containing protein n=1 Tax=Corynebacterium phoceense TaxID=1686286 RepID=A0A540R9N7_9CORY|nr:MULTISPECIES: helix-turn-helix domain-containing protein [Corynebacterium]OFL77043.1 MerR family transcriptional regulator [Corynebacterium sp. HMSC077B05]TQE44448.1 helix-turn-helix domain-containing protein [Corynebacterium phoceense]